MDSNQRTAGDNRYARGFIIGFHAFTLIHVIWYGFTLGCMASHGGYTWYAGRRMPRRFGRQTREAGAASPLHSTLSRALDKRCYAAGIRLYRDKPTGIRINLPRV